MVARIFSLSSDTRIVNLIRQGDEEGLVELYRENRGMIRSYVLKNGGNADDAEDLFQEALIVLWENIRTHRFEQQAKLSTFLYATVKYMWGRRRLRQRRENPYLETDEAVAPEASALEGMIDSEQTMRVQAALEQLGEPCKSILLLYYWEECSMEEIALKKGFANADTVKSKKYQCKKALKKILKERE
jgi:RNA polymerase sigma factor (sigma-70 family)